LNYINILTTAGLNFMWKIFSILVKMSL